jgi:hypothetical protein
MNPADHIDPEHAKRHTEGALHPEVEAAYRYVDSVVKNADPLSTVGAPAWHGWAIREAFLAGRSHARARAALPQPEGEGPSEQGIAEILEDLEWKRLPQVEGTGNSLLLDLALAVLARYGRPAIEPVPVVEGADG